MIAANGRPMRVLQLLGPSSGGIRRHVSYLVEHLRARGWEVAVAGPAGVLDDLDHVVPIPKRDRPTQTMRARRTLGPLLADVDLVHAHGLKPGLLAASFPSGPPMVLSVHNLVLDEVVGRSAPILRRLEGVLPGRAAATIAISDGVAARFEGRRGSDRISVIPPAGPPPEPTRSSADVRRELGIAADDDLVVTAARLNPQKDLFVLLDAAELALRRRPRLRWFVFGEGALHGRLAAEISRRGLESAVHLAGSRPNVDSELAAADVVVVTSRWESGPLVLLEAASLGTRVVSTDVGLARTVITPAAGRIAPVGDAAAIAEALVDVLATGDDDARPAVLAPDLQPSALAGRVEDVYREVVGRHG